MPRITVLLQGRRFEREDVEDLLRQIDEVKDDAQIHIKEIPMLTYSVALLIAGVLVLCFTTQSGIGILLIVLSVLLEAGKFAYNRFMAWKQRSGK